MNSKLNTQSSAFLNFIFAFIPGAAQLYLGFFKKGLTLLGSFASCIAMMALLSSIDVIAIIFTVPMILIYVYSFFDAFTMRRLLNSGERPEDTCALIAFYSRIFQGKNDDKVIASARYWKYIGLALLIVGLIAVGERILSYLPDYFLNMYSRLIALIFPVLLVVAGIVLIIKGMKAKKD